MTKFSKNTILIFALFLFVFPFLVSAITVNVSATPQVVNSGESSSISWTSTGALQCTLSGGGISGTGTNNPGVSTGPLSTTTTYTVTCTAPSGNLSATSCSIASGSSTCNSILNWSTEDLTINPTEVTINNPPNTHVSWATSGVNVSNNVNYGPSTFYLYHNGVILAEAPINASCESSTTWDGSKCSPSGGGMSGTLTPEVTTCSIPLGQGSCDINFSWNVVNPEVINGSEVTSNTPTAGTVVATGDSDSGVPFTVPYSMRVFYLYNNSVLLAQSTVYSDCEAGTYFDWTSNTCEKASGSLDITFDANPSIISLEQQTTLTWTSNGDYCTSAFFSGQGSASGSQSVTPPDLPHVYTIQCFGFGQSGSRSVLINGFAPKQPIYVEP